MVSCQIHRYGEIVRIRSENDEERLKYFTEEQKEIRRDWMRKRAGLVSEEELRKIMEGFKQAFIGMAGGISEAKQ